MIRIVILYEILFYFSQPNRVEKGDINLKLTNLPDKKGNITYTNGLVK